MRAMEWPEQLPGLDVAEAVGRLLNNQDIYQKVLECFFEDNQKFMSQLQEVCAAGDLAESRALLHALKGSSANISANRLSQFCLQLEQQVLSGRLLELAQVTQLDQVLQEVQDSIQQLLLYSDDSAEPVEQATVAGSVEVLSGEKLRELK